MGMIEGIEYFDADFFNISPREARLIEPQQRVFLEQCFFAINHANYSLEKLKGSLRIEFYAIQSQPSMPAEWWLSHGQRVDFKLQTHCPRMLYTTSCLLCGPCLGGLLTLH